jgi:hypothetical protein
MKIFFLIRIEIKPEIKKVYFTLNKVTCIRKTRYISSAVSFRHKPTIKEKILLTQQKFGNTDLVDFVEQKNFKFFAFFILKTEEK